MNTRTRNYLKALDNLTASLHQVKGHLYAERTHLEMVTARLQQLQRPERGGQKPTGVDSRPA